MVAKKKPAKKNECKLMCCTTPPEAVERIRADLEQWVAGGWAAQLSYGPACVCGLKVGGYCGLHPPKQGES